MVTPFGYFGIPNADNGWLLMLLVAMGLSMYAQFKVKSNFNRYLKVQSSSRMTGQQVAKAILERHGIYDVRIEPVAGNLTDHFDPRSKVVRLSEQVYNGTSISAVSIAAHEVGHAMQHNEEYLPLKIRSAIAPVASIGSRLVWGVIFLGFIISPILIELGIALYIGVVLFQVVTLPVEFNASSRALVELEDGIISRDEVRGSRKVLTAAALTYIAATLAAVAELLRLLSIVDSRRDRR